MTGQQQRIVVLGAGYAGLAAARGLARSMRGARITVVDTRAEFVERVRLHQAVAGQRVRRWDLRKMLGDKGIEFIQARVTDLDPAARRVRLDTGTELAYDTLVYALGSAADRSVPGVVEHARCLATPEDVRTLPAGPVVVVGAGATGIELAAELAEAHPESLVTLLGVRAPGAWLSARAVERIGGALADLGVEIRTEAKVVEVLPEGVLLADGTVVPAATVVWTAGFTVPDLARRAGLEVDEHGRVRTDETLRSRSHPAVYAAGDAALMTGPGDRPLRMACATAIPTGGYLARAIAARARGAEPKPMRFRYYLQCLSLGRRAAVIQVLTPDDRPARTVLHGRLGAWVKELIVRGAGMSVGAR
ncbi:FAD-dependent oxidoreductase [Nocardia sp. AG03]|uniref:NAD(P)/FAD-dependent oxidoreductase n=1 Tax=Nocardia sp. AG03 TaxID=3025312 RepID=UPI0024188450|nr:FAD-dependent oxidoreductase [Nocardia sp. AG03]